MSRDALVREMTYLGGAFWCETCGTSKSATKTIRRIFKSGREIQINWCCDCGGREETEFFKGPTIRIKNREE